MNNPFWGYVSGTIPVTDNKLTFRRSSDKSFNGSDIIRYISDEVGQMPTYTYPNRFYSCYDKIWYLYTSDRVNSDGSLKNFGGGKWHLSTDEHGVSLVISYNADKYRIDQCFEMFKKQLGIGVSSGKWYFEVDDVINIPLDMTTGTMTYNKPESFENLPEGVVVTADEVYSPYIPGKTTKRPSHFKSPYKKDGNGKR